MCGICGKLNPNGVTSDEIQNMLEKLAHRGPDDEGIYLDKNIGLGNRRLSVIDLPAGKQPISNETGTIWIVYNGEIYNYLQLRKKLEENGHTFRTNSDTEVIIHLYEDWGEDCVKILKGMFAFAIWDSHNEKLFLARDRIGQKPLYYSQEEKSFLFASEPKAILAISKQKQEINWEAAHHYLSLRFIPSPNTILHSISKLPPAHTLIFQNGQATIRQYWQLSFQENIFLTEGE